MTPFLQNQAMLLANLTNAVAGNLTGAKIDLYKNNLVFNPAVATLANFTLADYVGYAQGTLVWDAPTVSDDGNVESVTGTITFRPTNAVTPNDVFGYLVTNAGGDLIGGGYFDGPNTGIPMRSHLDSLKIAIVYRPSGDGGYAAVIS